MSAIARHKAWLQPVGLALGAALTLAAIGVALWHVDFSAIARAQPWHWVVMILAVAGNLVIGGVTFWVVTLSFDAKPPVTLTRTTTLVAATALANYLPLRPGIAGRAAYLKLRHGLPLRQSLIILLIVTILGTALVIVAALAALLLRSQGATAIVGVALAFVLLLMIITGPIAQRVLRRPLVAAWSWPLFRAADLALASLRLWVAFEILGHPVPLSVALLTGSGGVLVSLVGLTPNGLGMEEWTVAALTAATADLPDAAALGLAAALVDRAFEAIVVVPAGTLALRWLAREARDVPTSETHDVASSGTPER
jgi:uncharacterized membrane protein YbhN (UPF0104 family)